MNLEAQKHAPVYEALEKLRKKRVVPFESYRTKCVDENRFQALKIKG